MARPDFENVWGSTNAPFTAITDTDYKAGWVFRTGAPPRRVNFDYFQNLSDQRHQWLGEQMLQTVGHDWQDDVTYDAYAVTRSPMDGRLYRSLTAGNIGNEPSASGAQWALGVVEQETVPESILTSGIAGSFSNLKASATGTSATVTVTADSICLKNASNEQVVVNTLALAINSATVGANGLDAGVLAASTWYHVWVIWNGSTAAGLLSLSPTAPTMPAGYTHKARIGEIRTDATANKYPLSYYQYGDLIQINKAAGTNVPAMIAAASGSTGGVMAPLGLSSFVPTTAFSARISAYSSGDANCQIGIAPSTAYGIYEFSGGSGPSSAGVFAVSLLTEVPLIPGSMTIGIHSNTAGARFYVNGWRTQL